MKDKIKGLIAGILIGIIIATTTVIASNRVVKKDLHYNNIKITMNGEEVKPTDANGNYVEPFIIDGTTYLPVRGIANALGLNVEWDSATKTVKLSDDEYVQSEKTNVEKYVDTYGDVLADAFDEGLSSSGLVSETTVTAEGNTIILNSNIRGFDNVPADTKEELQNYFNEQKHVLKEDMEGIQTYIPELEKIVFNMCEEDGDFIASVDVEF